MSANWKSKMIAASHKCDGVVVEKGMGDTDWE
jgi:hypothetical protein